MILTCSSIRLTTHLIRIILTHALTFYARFRVLNLFLQKAPVCILHTLRLVAPCGTILYIATYTTILDS